MIEYKHTQVGWVIIIATIIMFLVLGFLTGPLSGQETFIAGVGILAVLLILVFGWLTVEVADEAVRVIFGIGLIHFKFMLSDIAEAQPRRIKWYSGYGIHGWPGKGWLLNVSGLDTVELIMKNGMRYLIGTDEPQDLYKAIEPTVHRVGAQ